jgi:F0F1-type ATP synthase membrane subunit b/b'
MGALFKEAEAEERRLKATAHRISEDQRQKGEQEANRLVHQVLDEIKDLHQEAEKNLKMSLAKAREQIEAESSDLTASIIQHLVDRRS